jgi:hypothetical protein
MLNIFNRNSRSPDYKTLAPVESITVKEEVWTCMEKAREETD